MNLYVTKDGQRLGPYALSEAQALVAAGTLQPMDWAWYEGIPDWIPLQQVPGFVRGSVSIGATPSRMAAGSPVEVTRVRRPILVWIICIFYFVTIPLGLLSLAAIPYLLTYTNQIQQQVDATLQTQVDHATNLVQKEQLTAAQMQIRASEVQMKSLAARGPLYYGFAVFSMLVNLAAAILLFLLRRSAFPAFIGAFVISMLGAIYNFTQTTLPSRGGAAEQFGFAIGICSAVFFWGIMLAIIFYVWSLRRKGVLTDSGAARSNSVKTT